MKLYEYFFWVKPVDLHDPEAKELIERTDRYRDMCMELNIVPTLTDYAFCLGYTRSSVCDYRDGRSKCPQKVREILFAVTRWLEASLCQVGFNNPLLGTYVIWLQKNFFGFRDNIDINVSHQLMDSQSAQDIMQRYKYIEASVVTPELEEKPIIDVVAEEIKEKETS